MLLLHSSKNYSINTAKELSRKINKVVFTPSCFRGPVMYDVVTYGASEQKILLRYRTDLAYMTHSVMGKQKVIKQNSYIIAIR